VGGSTKQTFHVNQKGPVVLGFEIKRKERIRYSNVEGMPNDAFCIHAGVVGLVTGQEEPGKVPFDHKGFVACNMQGVNRFLSDAQRALIRVR
tara:strand:+ start:162 stop:437 length:276 start_codon:yes stop_codon:yes gene_type:complete